MKFEHDYEKALVESGEAAFKVVAEMVEAEAIAGNPRNIPIPVLIIYTMGLSPILSRLEQQQAPIEERAETATKLNAAMAILHRCATLSEDQAGLEAVLACREELRTRARPLNMMGIGEDLTYGGLIPA